MLFKDTEILGSCWLLRDSRAIYCFCDCLIEMPSEFCAHRLRNLNSMASKNYSKLALCQLFLLLDPAETLFSVTRRAFSGCVAVLYHWLGRRRAISQLAAIDLIRWLPMDCLPSKPRQCLAFGKRKSVSPYSLLILLWEFGSSVCVPVNIAPYINWQWNAKHVKYPCLLRSKAACSS